MKIDLQIDTRGLEAKTLREQKRLAYNTAEAINNTAKTAQAAIQDHMREAFHLRGTSKKDRRWLLQRIKISFASARKGIVYAEVYIDQKARLLLAAFETGELREPFIGKNVAVPNPSEARQGADVGGEIKPELTFTALKMMPFTVTPRSRPDTIQYKGKNRTFGLKSTAQNPLGGVYERVGPGRDDIRLVYSFRRAFKLKAVLDFVTTATTVIRDRFPIEWIISNARNPSR